MNTMQRILTSVVAVYVSIVCIPVIAITYILTGCTLFPNIEIRYDVSADEESVSSEEYSSAEDMSGLDEHLD